MTELSRLFFIGRARNIYHSKFWKATKKNGQEAEAYSPKSSLHCGAYVTRTRDPLRDRQVF